MAKSIVINVPGPQGPVGPIGPQGPPGSPGDFSPSSLVTTSSFNTFTSSYYTDSASFDSRINNITVGNVDLSGYTTTSSFNTFTSSYKLDSASFSNRINNVTFDTSSLVTTSSFNSFTSSYKLDSASFIASINTLTNATSSYVTNAQTSSFIRNTQTGSFVTTSSFNSFTGSYIADSSSFNSKITNLTAATSSYVLNSSTSSFVTTASFNAFTASYNTGSFSGSFIGTASWANNYSETDPIFTSKSASFATTGSNIFKGNQVITGSLTITNDLIVLGSSSITYISQSTLNIGTNLITVNANSPSVRFGGLAVIDSGSSPQKSGSILFDSENNQWIFVHQSIGGAVTSSVFIQGPQTFNNVGGETTLTTNKIPKAVGGDLGEHIGDSNITDTGTVVSINSNTEITGSLIQGLPGNTATGEYSHAEGSITKAIGNYSHAEGDFTQAKGDYSHAEGQETIASGSYSHAEGYQTIALGDRQHVTGQYNFVSPVQSAFIVGNGTDNGNRSNLIYAHDSVVEITGSISSTLGITSSLYGTASWANNYNETDPIFSAKEGSLVTTSSFNIYTGSVDSQISSLTLQTSSYVQNNQTSSFVLNYQTSSFVLNSQTSSFVQNSQTSSMTVFSSSFALTASYIDPTFISASAAASGFGSGGGGGVSPSLAIAYAIALG